MVISDIIYIRRILQIKYLEVAIVLKIQYGIITFIVGFIIAFVFSVFCGSDGGSGVVTNGSFLSGVAFVSGTILFLSGVVVTCTLMIIDVIKSKKN